MALQRLGVISRHPSPPSIRPAAAPLAPAAPAPDDSIASRVATLEAQLSQLDELRTSVRDVHQRVGGVARSTDRLCGRVDQMNGTLTLLAEHLLARERKP